MDPLYFKEFRAHFDTNRARLNLGSGQTVSIVAGVETGQLVGALQSLEGWQSMPPAVAQNHS